MRLPGTGAGGENQSSPEEVVGSEVRTPRALSPEARSSGTPLEFRLSRNCAQLFFLFSVSFSRGDWFSFDCGLLPQGIEQRIQNTLEGSGVLHQEPLHTFAVYRQFSNWPRPTDVNSTPWRRKLSPTGRAQCSSRKRMVETSGGHPVNHEFLDMVDTAGELNACPGGHRLVPMQNRQLVLPGVFGDQKPGLARGSLLSADRTQRGSRMIHKAPFNSARYIFT